MDQFERDFEHLDVQTQTMEDAMSGVTTLTTPEVRWGVCVCVCVCVCVGVCTWHMWVGCNRGLSTAGG